MMVVKFASVDRDTFEPVWDFLVCAASLDFETFVHWKFQTLGM